MLTLALRQFREKLPVWIEARLAVAVIGPPGTGKTYTSRQIAVATGLPVEVVDGGKENDWKALFPYRTPEGAIELGKALLADGGVLLIDEFNRVPPEMKTSFQLLASERIVPWPEGGGREVNLAIIATANGADLGVEEAGRAELDRYDLIVCLMPTPEEMAVVVAATAGVRPEVAGLVYTAVAELASGLDTKKFHQPEGLRMAISIAKLLRTGTLGSVDVFRGAAERCFPLGRVGAERFHAEFDGAVADVAGRFASRLAQIGELTAKVAQLVQQVGPAPTTLLALRAQLPEAGDAPVVAPALPLPNAFVNLMHVFTLAFGAGVALYFMKAKSSGRSVAERTGVKIHFGAQDQVEFTGASKSSVDRFLQLIL